MAPKIKAVVFKTSRLKETKAFFAANLGFVVRESSLTHFVICSKGIRILFVASSRDPGVELYAITGSASIQGHCKLTCCEDPNNIRIIISGPHQFRSKDNPSI